MKRNRQHQLLFPLTIFDTTKNIMIDEYNTKENTQYAIDRYQSKQNKYKVNILVTNYPAYYDFTDFFTNVYS
jgi:hypothetical protein